MGSGIFTGLGREGANLEEARIRRREENRQDAFDRLQKEREARLIEQERLVTQQAKAPRPIGDPIRARDGKLYQRYADPLTGAISTREVSGPQEETMAEETKRTLDEFEKITGIKLTDAQKQDIVLKRFGVTPARPLAPKVTTKLLRDPGSKTGYSWVSYDPISGSVYSEQKDAPPQRGLISSETVITDNLGNRTVSIRTPLLPGGTQGSPTAKPEPGPAATPTPSPRPSPAIPRLGAPGARGGVSARPPAGSTLSIESAQALLDENGHIPPSPNINPQVLEAANELMDGKDIDKLPAKSRLLAGQLARKFGWSQGRFTPKEQVQLRVATGFIDRAMRDGSMKALDGSALDKAKLLQIINTSEKQGLFGDASRFASSLLSGDLTEEQKEYLRTYNQLVGTIAGLSQLVRSGRATEATIERLKKELPNPIFAPTQADAIKSLKRLRDEIDLAMEKGTFEGGSAPGRQPTAPLSNRPAAPRKLPPPKF